jgi:hypothetical protein
MIENSVSRETLLLFHRPVVKVSQVYKSPQKVEPTILLQLARLPDMFHVKHFSGFAQEPGIDFADEFAYSGPQHRKA